MSALEAIVHGLEGIGYRPPSLIRDYTFADVMSATGRRLSVALAAFTQTPASYRSAAFGVIEAAGNDLAALVMEHRALGAPIILSVTADAVTVWQVRSHGRPIRMDQVPIDRLPKLFAENAAVWRPEAVHRAKSIGQLDPVHQLDFVDIGLLPAIESEIHAKLDRLLQEVTEDIAALAAKGPGGRFDERFIFQMTFRLLAAKVLQDRQHEVAIRWDPGDTRTVLEGIARYYGLHTVEILQNGVVKAAVTAAWDRLRRAIDFRNISADDLAFVYENTLVTKESRKHFGTHSTPRQLAEYIVSRLDLPKLGADAVRLYEPFTGAGTFLVSALRHLGGLLPMAWDEADRHRYLVERIRGSELDAFACEVANLSLILADYPNANGWRIYNEDLFENGVLAKRLAQSNVVVCNPPFEDFTPKERARYADFASYAVQKPRAILEKVLDARPVALGFVLPRGFISGTRYGPTRQRIEELYSAIELVSLPDRIFKESSVESALLIAKERRSETRSQATRLTSTLVHDRDRVSFLATGLVTSTRHGERAFAPERLGDLWLRELGDIWEYLAANPRLREIAAVHRGLEWKYDQSLVSREEPAVGFREGLHTVRGAIVQFTVTATTYLDCRPEALRRGTPRWFEDKPKLIATAARLGRGPWRMAAAIDTRRLVCSQQFFGVWPRLGSPPLEVLAAILNSPLANAFLAVEAPQKGIRVEAVEALPLPTGVDEDHISRLVHQYRKLLVSDRLLTDVDKHAAPLTELLVAIDAEVLRGYDLPPRAERELLDFFQGYRRPTAHKFGGWFAEEMSFFIPLHEYVSKDYRKLTGRWVLDVFEPIPEDEAKALVGYVD